MSKSKFGTKSDAHDNVVDDTHKHTDTYANENTHILIDTKKADIHTRTHTHTHRNPHYI